MVLNRGPYRGRIVTVLGRSVGRHRGKFQLEHEDGSKFHESRTRLQAAGGSSVAGAAWPAAAATCPDGNARAWASSFGLYDLWVDLGRRETQFKALAPDD